MSTTALVFLLLVFSGCVLAFLRHPIFGLYAYLVVFYVAPENAWWSSEVPDVRWSLIVAIATLIATLAHSADRNRQPWFRGPGARPLIAFTVWLWIQLPWALSFDDQLFIASLFTKYLVLYAVMYRVLSDYQSIEGFGFAHILGCFVWGLLAYQNPGSGRLEALGSGDVAGSAFASMQMSTGLIFAGFAFIGFANWKRWIALAAIPFIINALILMVTRAAFIGLIAAAPIAYYLAPVRQRRFVLLSLVLGGVLGATLANDLFWSRISTIPGVGEAQQHMESSAASRIDIATANIRMFGDHPWGVGHRGNDILSPKYMPSSLMASGEDKRSAHNTLMAVLVDHGLPGLLIFLCIHWSIARAVWGIKGYLNLIAPSIRPFAAALGPSLVAYWANAQFANMTKSEIVLWIAVLAGAIKATVSSTRGPAEKTAARRSESCAEDGQATVRST